MPNAPIIQYDPSGVFSDTTGIKREELVDLYARLEVARREVLPLTLALGVELPLDEATPRASALEPLDAGFFELPEHMLKDYHARRHSSDLGRILKLSHRLRESVDRVVILGTGGSSLGARAIMDACCDPYFNELSRGERGSRPRLYFEGNNFDNDAAQGLLKLLGGKPATDVGSRWAIVVISKNGGTLETAVAFRQYLAALRRSTDGDSHSLAELVIPVTGRSGKPFELARALGCHDRFEIPHRVENTFSVFSTAGILPAAILGTNVVELLAGAGTMNHHFRTAPVEQNLVLNYVGVCHLLESRHQIHNRELSVWAKALEAFALWYDQLLVESLGKRGRCATPMTAVNPRDRDSHPQPHPEGRREKLITNVIVESWRCDPLRVEPSDFDQDELNEFADRTLPELMAAAIAGTNQNFRDEGQPTADIRLPMLCATTLGQLLQMMMIATVVEGRLTGLNP